MNAPFRRPQLVHLRAALGSPAPCPLPVLADVTLSCVTLTNALVLELLSHAKQLNTPALRVAELLLSSSCVLSSGLVDPQVVRVELSRLENAYSKHAKSGKYWAPLDEVCEHVLLPFVEPHCTDVSK